MAHFHVFVREEGETSLRVLATDLSECVFHTIADTVPL